MLCWFLLYNNVKQSSVQFDLVTQLCLFATPWIASCQASLSPIHELAQTHVHWVSDDIQPSQLPSSLSPPAFDLSLIRVFSNESALCIWWPKYWSFSLSISPSNEYSVPYDGLVGSSCSLRESHESSPTPQLKSINSLALSFMVQLSHPYMTTGKTIALTRWTFVSKVTSLLFNMLSRFVIAFLPRSKRLLISWLQSPSAVVLEPRK